MTRMSHADAAWLHMETPTNLMMITGLVLLDSVPERAWMESVLEYRLCHFERFRMKVVEPAGLGLPHWERATDFEVGAHLVYEELAEPTMERFLERVSELMSTPLDRERPLWEFRLFPGVGRGCAISPSTRRRRRLIVWPGCCTGVGTGVGTPTPRLLG